MIYLILLETEGDREYFRLIYEENYLKMYHIALHILKQQAEAENAVHEAFLALAERFEKYSHLNRREMAGFCVSIVKNKAIDMIRYRKHYSEADIEQLILYDEKTESNPEDAFEIGEEAGMLIQMLRQISAVYRETLILKYCYDLSNREIAKLQEVSVKTVEMRLYRGKLKLKEILFENGSEGSRG